MKTIRLIFTVVVIGIGCGWIAGCANSAFPGNPNVLDSRGTTKACSSRPTPWITKARASSCHIDRGKSWMMHVGKSMKLLYVSDIGDEGVDVFSYADKKQVGHLSGFNEPNGLCADRTGDVFVSDTYNSRVVEYAHGSTKSIDVFEDPNNYPMGCAIDRTTGNLAVTNYNYLATGSIAIYKEARGKPTLYTGLWITYFCTYDNVGNLFIDGFNTLGAVVLGELKKGGTTLTTIPLNVRAGWAGGLEWDGKHLALGDQLANKFESEPYPNVIYRLSIQNGMADVVSTTPLASAGDVIQFWFQGRSVIGPDASNEDVGFWKYPSGGNPKSLIRGLYEPVGTTVSE
jgi:hypothetical protein